jgi:hypothetical protein
MWNLDCGRAGAIGRAIFVKRQKTCRFTVGILIIAIILFATPSGEGLQEIGGLRVGTEVLDTAILDSTNGYAYFGTWANDPSASGKIIRIRLSDFSLDGILELRPGEGRVISSTIDPSGRFAYFGVEAPNGGGSIIEVQLSDFQRIATSKTEGDYDGGPLLLDSDGLLYAIGNVQEMYRLSSSDLSDVGDFVSGVSTPIGVSAAFSNAAVIDTTNHYIYVGTNAMTGFSSPGYILRIDLYSVLRMNAVTTLDVDHFANAQEGDYGAAVIDSSNGYAYFATETSPSVVVRVNLRTFSYAGSLTLNGDDQIDLACIDTKNGFAYFATLFPSIIVRIRLSDFSRLDSLSLGQSIYAMAVDSQRGFAYLGTAGEIVKVSLALSSVTTTSNTFASSSLNTNLTQYRAYTMSPSIFTAESVNESAINGTVIPFTLMIAGFGLCIIVAYHLGRRKTAKHST